MNYNDVLLEFTMNNTDATNAITIINPILLFSEFRVLINNQEMLYHDNTEKIFCAYAGQLRKLISYESLISNLAVSQPYNASGSNINPLLGTTINAGSSATLSLPLFDMLLPHLKNFSLLDGINTLSFEFRYTPNYNTLTTVTRLCQSSANVNVYGSVTYTNILCRLLQSKNSNKSLVSVANSGIIPLHKYEDRTYVLNWTNVGNSQSVKLNNDFSNHSMCHAIYVYAVNTPTTYNDANCIKVDSGCDLLGMELKFRSRTILKLDQVTDLKKRQKYMFDGYAKRYNGIGNNLLLGTDNFTNVFCPLFMIDLQNIKNMDVDNLEIHSGLNNMSNDIELIITNQKAYSAQTTLHVILAYYEFSKLSSGILSFTR
jgi:hypothetical protein